jgi:hypothetical protein
MSNTRSCMFVLVILALTLSGCSTTLNVERVTDSNKPKGFHYSLPVSLLQVCPGAQGAISVKEVFLPDPANQYAISASSVISKFNLDVTVEDGLLTKFAWKPDSSGVAEKLVETSGNLAKTRIETEAKADELKATQLAEAEKARKAALEAADKAIRDAELELSTAKAALAVLQGRTGVDEELLAAEIAVAKAEAKLAAAKEDKNRLLAAGEAAIPGANNPIDDKSAQAFGCILYRVIDDATAGVKLVATQSQGKFQTSFKVTPRTEEKKEPLEIQIKDTVVIKPKRDKSLFFIVSSTLPVKIISEPTLRLLTSSTGQPEDVTSRFKPFLTPGGNQFRVDLADGTPAGEYDLSVELEAVGHQKTKKSVKFVVRR